MHYFNKRLCDILENVWAKIKGKWSFEKKDSRK